MAAESDPPGTMPPIIVGGSAMVAAATAASEVAEGIAQEVRPLVGAMDVSAEPPASSALAPTPSHVDDVEAPKVARPVAEEGEKKTVPLKRLFRYADTTDKILMALGTAGAIAAGATLPIFAILFGKLTDSLGLNINDVNKLVSTVNHYALILLFVAIATWVVASMEVGLWMLAGERITSKIREEYLKAVLRQDVGYFDTSMDSGALISHITGDTILIGDAIGEKVGNFFHHMATFIVGFIVGFYLSWQLTLVMLAVTPLLAAAGYLMNRALTDYATRGQAAYAESGSLAMEAIGAIRTVKAFTLEEKIKRMYGESMEKALKAGIRGGFAQGLGMGAVYFNFYSTTALSLWYGSRLVQYNGYEGGAIISAFFSVLLAGFGLGNATPSLAKFATGRAAAYHVYKTIDRKPAIDIDDLSGQELTTVKGDIEFRNVRFAYPSRPEAIIFQDFSLKVSAGETVALVGESGSGKSTVVSLLERYYDPLEGEVLVDGVDIRSLRVRSLRQRVGLVSQEPALFAVTIRENISYGREGATLEEVIAAAKAANAHNFIKSLPDGYETHVGERGVQMSGGQKQRVAIARAVLKNPSILLLDEATSALDTESERIVQDALDRLMEGRTSIVIAHRLSTIINADRICVVQKGVVVEEGKHSDLIANPEGHYTALVKLQQAAQEKNKEALGDAEPDALPEQTRGSMGSRRMSLDGVSSVATQRQDVEKSDGKGGLRKRKGWFSKATEEDPEKEKYVPPKAVPITRVFSYAKPEWWRLVIGVAAAAGNGILMPMFALMFSHIIDTFYNFSDPSPQAQKDARNDANFWSLMFFIVACWALMVNTLQLTFLVSAGAYLTRRIREIAFGSILRQEVAYFDEEKNTSGALAGRLENDAGLVKAAVGDRMGLIVQNLTTFSAGLIIAFVNGWRLALVVLAVFPLILVGAYLNITFFKGFSGEAKKLQEEANAVAAEAVSNIRTVAAFNLEEKTRSRYSESLKLPLTIGAKKAQVAGIGFGYSQFVLYASYSLAFWFGGIMIKQGHMTFQEVLLTFFAIIFSAMGVSEGAMLAPDVSKGKMAVDCTFEIIDREPAINAEDPKGKVLDKVRGDVELVDVHFVYPTRPNAVIFRNFNLKVEAGQSVALVGESGSGKSTVVSLIERFYDPLEGRVLIDGVDIKDLQLLWLRRQVGLVSQEPVLFATSIWDNIADGKPNATKEEIEKAAEAANASSFIARLPEGYATFVGDRGVQLSGGQKQRIAIARAVLKNPSILLLDEATSALDTESEKVVQEALDRLMEGRTSIVIAHRLSTITNCSKICVVQKGHIIEEGAHDELMAKNGAYASLARARKDTT